jgi:hypothetical protein
MKQITTNKTVFRILRNDAYVADELGYPAEGNSKYALPPLEIGDKICEMAVKVVATYHEVASEDVQPMTFTCLGCDNKFDDILINMYTNCPHCKKMVELLDSGIAVDDGIPF